MNFIVMAEENTVETEATTAVTEETTVATEESTVATEETTTKTEAFVPQPVASLASGVQAGIGGVGYVGDRTWRQWVNNMNLGGDVELVGGIIPNRNDAFRLINAVSGTVIRAEIHEPGGTSHHTYWHMHYKTGSCVYGVLRFSNN